MLPQEYLRALSCPECHGPLEPGKHPTTREEAVICWACGLAYPMVDGVLRFLDPEDVANDIAGYEGELYEASLAEPDVWTLREHHHSKEELVDLILQEEADRMAGSVVLNAGCGRDALGPSIGPKVKAYLQADIALAALRELRRKGSPCLVHCDVSRLPVADASCDFVVAVDIVHHFATRSVRTPLQEFVRVLKPGGRLYLQEQNRLAMYRLPLAFLPHPARILLRKMRHWHDPAPAPAPYEAPLFAGRVIRALRGLGAESVRRYPVRSYPQAGPKGKRLFEAVSKVAPAVPAHFSAQWLLKATKAAEESRTRAA